MDYVVGNHLNKQGIFKAMFPCNTGGNVYSIPPMRLILICYDSPFL